VNLSTRYLGLTLDHPFVVGASPIVDDLDLVRRAEDAGAAAIVMHSLFEEQLTADQLLHHEHVDAHASAHPEAQSYFPEQSDFALGPDEYLEQLRRIKQAVSVPVFGSLNGVSNRGWLDHAKQIEEAGADGLELNVYYLATDGQLSAAQVEEKVLSMVRHVRAGTSLPLAVKLSPSYSSLANFAGKLVEAGANGLVLFNRYFEPDIDLEELDLRPKLELSSPSELRLRLRWVAALYGRVDASLAVTGGVHTAEDALKAVMAGAHAVQMVSALLRHGPEHMRSVVEGVRNWLTEREYESLEQAQGSMSVDRCPDPTHYQRGNYVRTLQSHRHLALGIGD